jgi:hypothetical protein
MKHKANNEQIYGIFAESESDSDESTSSTENHGKRKKSKRMSTKANYSNETELKFVSSSQSMKLTTEINSDNVDTAIEEDENLIAFTAAISNITPPMITGLSNNAFRDMLSNFE